MLYMTAVFAVLRSTSPSSVIKQASVRALVFPALFFVTICPAWLSYAAIVSSDSWVQWSMVCIYSNGWVNAAAYALQHRKRLCRNRRHAEDLVEPAAVAARVSFHVGFGNVSQIMVSPLASPFPSPASSTIAAAEGDFW